MQKSVVLSEYMPRWDDDWAIGIFVFDRLRFPLFFCILAVIRLGRRQRPADSR